MRLFKRKSKWVEEHGHDVSILPGGRVLHHSICWCKSAPSDTGVE